MTVGLSVAIANDILDALCKNAALSTIPVSAFWVQLHTGDPGSAGTANVAGNDTRKQGTFGTVASGGAIANTAALSWSTSEVDTSEDYTHFSAWSAAGAGTFLMSGLITSNPVIVGDQFTLAIGDLDLVLSIAS